MSRSRSKSRVLVAPPTPVVSPAATPAAPPAVSDSPAESFFSQAYSGAAELGRVTGKITLVIGNIVAAIMIVVGIYLLVTKPDPPSSFKLTKNLGNDGGIDTTGRGFNFPPPPPPGQNLLSDAERAAREYEDRKKSRKLFGWMLLGFGLVVLIGVWAYWYVISKSKFAAAASGVDTATDLLLPDFLSGGSDAW
jgi:hypothetical protein